MNLIIQKLHCKKNPDTELFLFVLKKKLLFCKIAKREVFLFLGGAGRGRGYKMIYLGESSRYVERVRDLGIY